MKLRILPLILIAACSSNPHKAEKIDTTIQNNDRVTDGTQVGVKDGNMVVQKKVVLAEELRDLQYEVYGLEDRVYGNTKYRSTGLYGNLKDCRRELSDKKNGGSGKLIWTEPVDRVTDKEEDLKFGLDENDKLVGVSEEFLKDRIERFRRYKQTLIKRNAEYEEKIDICKTELASQQYELKQKSAKASGQGE